MAVQNPCDNMGLHERQDNNMLFTWAHDFMEIGALTIHISFLRFCVMKS